MGRAPIRPTFVVGVAAVVVASSCVAPPAPVPGTVADNTIDITHQLPADFALNAAIDKLLLLIDEADGGAPLYSEPISATSGNTGDGRSVTLAVDDFDSDSRYEAQLTFAGDPFDGGRSWLLSIEGSPSLPAFVLRATIFRADGGTSEPIATATASGAAGTTRFGGGRQQLTLTYDCMPGIVCRSGDSDGGPVSRLLLVPTGIPQSATQLVAVVDQGLLGGTTTVELLLADDAGTIVDLAKTSNYRVRVIATRSYEMGTRSVIGGASQSGISLADGGQVVVALALSTPTATNTSPVTVKPDASVTLTLVATDPANLIADGQLTFVHGFAPFSNGVATRRTPPASGASLSVAQSVSTPVDGGIVYFQIELAAFNLFAVDGGPTPMLYLPNVAQGASLYSATVTNDTTGILLRTTAIPSGTTHVTAGISGPAPRSQIVLPVTESAVTAIGLGPGAGYIVSATAVSAPTSSGRLLGLASILNINLDAGSWVSVDLPFQTPSRTARTTPSAVLGYQPFTFDDAFAARVPPLQTSGNFYYQATPFTNSDYPLNSVFAEVVNTDAGVIRFTQQDATTSLPPGTTYYQFRANAEYSVTPPGVMNATFFYPDTQAGQALDTIAVGDAAAVVNLAVSSIPAGTTHVTAALQGGPSSRTRLAVPFDGGTGGLAIECYPSPPNYNLLVTAFIIDTDAGTARLVATGSKGGVTVDAGATPIAVALGTLSRVSRATPSVVSGYAPIQFDETYAVPDSNVIQSAAFHYQATPFTNATYPQYSTGASSTVIDAGVMRFAPSVSNATAAPGTVYYQFRASLNWNVTPSSVSSPYYYYPDTQAGQSLETIAVTDAAATVNVNVTGIPVGTTHVTAALQGGPTNRTQINVPFDGGVGAVAIECHYGPPNYEVLVSAVIIDGGPGRLLAAGSTPQIAVDAGLTSTAVNLVASTHWARGTPACVVAWSAFQFDETFAFSSGSIVAYGYFWYQATAFTNSDYPTNVAYASIIGADAGTLRFAQLGMSTSLGAGITYYQFRGYLQGAVSPPAYDANLYSPDTQAGHALETITVTSTSCP